MSRPAELADRAQLLEPVTGIDQRLGIARPAGRIATDINHLGHGAGGDPFDLVACAGPRRIEYHGVEAVELFGQ